MERKPRGDSKLDSLPDSQRAELVQGILEGWTYDQAREWVRDVCKVSVSLSAFSPFYQRHVAPVLRERKQFAALSAQTIARLAEESEAFDGAAIAELKEYAYRVIRDPNSNPKEARAWMETLIKAQAGARDSRKLAILEAKAAQADSAKDVLAQKLTPEEQTRRLREILK